LLKEKLKKKRGFSFMKVGLHFEYDKLHLKEVVILMPKKHPNVVSFLTPLLSLYGINVKDFINTFEELTRFIGFDIVVPVKVKITKIKTFKMSLRTPYVISILSQVVDLTATDLTVNVLDVYKLCLLKSVFTVSSTFNHFFYRPSLRVYLWLRKYLSITIASDLLSKVNETINLRGLYYLPVLRKSLISLSNFGVLVSNQFGVFTIFNNLSGPMSVELKITLDLVVNMYFSRVNPNFLAMLTGMPFSGHVYYFSAPYLSCCSDFLADFSSRLSFGSLFALYYRYRNNLMHGFFFKKLLIAFKGFLKEGVAPLFFIVRRLLVILLLPL
jgi:ribosomal protein L11